MNLLRPSVRGASKSLLLSNSYRCASYNSAIHRGISREASSSRQSFFHKGSARPYSRDREGSSRPPFNPDREGPSKPPFNNDREGGSSRPSFNREDGGSSRPPFKRDYEGGASRPSFNNDREGGSSRPSYNREDGGSSRPPFKRDYEGGRPSFNNDREGRSSRPSYRDDGSSFRPPYKRDYEGGSSRPSYRDDGGSFRPPYKRDYEGGSSRPPYNKDRDASSPRTFGRDREGPPRSFQRDSDSSRPYSKDREHYSKSAFAREDGSPARTFNRDRDASSPRTFGRDRESTSRPFNRDSETSPRAYNRDQERPTTYRRDDRSAAPEYTRTPRRTIQKVNQDSEWIYGSSVVEAALKSNRRQLYRLYIHAGENRTASCRERDIKLKNLARGLKIDVREVEESSILDSMSDSRPHNGYVLEASKILKTPIISLSNVSFDKATFGLQIAQHDFTESGLVLSELSNTVPNRSPTRYPLVLMLDEILDPGNLGAIIRSAYFLGCSALLVAERNCAPLSPICLKSSVGASEYMPILTHVTPPRLIEASKAAGWKFFAAAPRPAKHASSRYIEMEHELVQSALESGPVVLLMGGEGEGLRESIKKKCDKCISITAAPDVDRGVDSLNVSVAAGVLMQAFLGKKAATASSKATNEEAVVGDIKSESGSVATEAKAAAVKEVAVGESIGAMEGMEEETAEAEDPAETMDTTESESAEEEAETEPVDPTEPAKST